MMNSVVKELTNTKRFQTVVLSIPGSAVQPPQAGTILLTGQLLEFSPGNRAGRILSGGLIEHAATHGRLGEANARAHIQFVDSVSGNVLQEQDVESVVRGKPFDMNIKHTFGPSASETGQGIAKKIAKVAKSNF